MEMLAGGNLRDRLMKRNPEPYPEPLAAKYMRSMHSAMLYCHNHSVRAAAAPERQHPPAVTAAALLRARDRCVTATSSSRTSPSSRWVTRRS